MTETLRDAHRVLPVFDGDRLLATRELTGLTQAELAKRVGITPSALSQIEHGTSRPTAANLLRLVAELDVTPDAMTRRPQPATKLRPQFRHLRRTPLRERRRATRLVEAADVVVKVLSTRVRLPAPLDLTHPVDPESPIETVAHDVEAAAAEARQAIGAGRNEPLESDWISLPEQSGIIVIRDPETVDNIDAYSAVINDMPVVVLDGGTQSVWDRDNFTLAHEIGHLVMHRNSTVRPGTKTAEDQAHRFAGAFLAPADAIKSELPADLDWGAYLELKMRWGMSMAALVRRARDIGAIADSMYIRAMKQRSAYGWRLTEPGNELRPLPTPSLLARAAQVAEMTIEEIAVQAGIPTSVARRIIGPGQRPAIQL